MDDDQGSKHSEDDQLAPAQPAESESEPAAEEPPPPMLGSAGTTKAAAQNRDATQQSAMDRVRSFFNRK